MAALGQLRKAFRRHLGFLASGLDKVAGTFRRQSHVDRRAIRGFPREFKQSIVGDEQAGRRLAGRETRGFQKFPEIVIRTPGDRPTVRAGPTIGPTAEIMEPLPSRVAQFGIDEAGELDRKSVV